VSHLGERPFVHETAIVSESRLGPWTEIGPNCSVIESTVGDYSYMAGENQVI
jgi:hypothetical protein